MPPTVLFVRVYGEPAPQGSKSFKGTFRDKGGRQRGIMVESSKKVAPWRDSVALAVVNANMLAGLLFDGPVRLTVRFLMPRGKSEPKKTRPHTRAPDLSKLVRATEDAITTSGAWRDDAQVVELVAIKETAEPGEAAGCFIYIEAIATEGKSHVEEKSAEAAVARSPGRAGKRGGGGVRERAAAAAGKRGKWDAKLELDGGQFFA